MGGITADEAQPPIGSFTACTRREIDIEDALEIISTEDSGIRWLAGSIVSPWELELMLKFPLLAGFSEDLLLEERH